MQHIPGGNIPKEALLQIIKKLLRTDLDLSFLMELELQEMEQLVAVIRERIDEPW